MKEASKKNYKTVSKKIKAKELCPGISWKTSISNGDGSFDKEIIPLLKLLNTEDWHTVASCAGHSMEYLQNSGKGYGIDDPYRIFIFIHIHNHAIPKFIKLMRNFYDVSHERLCCELGYIDDFSNRVEKNYLPFKIMVFCGTKPVRDRILGLYEKIARDFILKPVFNRSTVIDIHD